MIGASESAVRPPAVAGRFYPAESDRCRAMAESFLKADVGAAEEKRWIGAIVPHAGWICSGAIAGEAIGTLKQSLGNDSPDVVVVFGAVHTPLPLDCAALASHEQWTVPGGSFDVPRELSGKLES